MLGSIASTIWDANWSKGDEFMAGDARRFRIVGMVGVPDDVGIYNALWKVESVSD
jgi:hypothetical protein